MGDALYKNLEGMSQSRGLPGGYTTARSGRVGSSSRESGLSGTLSRLASGRGGRNRQAVYQPITPMMDTKYSGKAGGIAGVGFGLKAVANVMQAIENYKAAQDMLTIAQEERDAAKEQAARELMEKSRAPLIALAQTMNEMPEEERAAFGQELMEGGAAQGLDPSSMNLLKLTMKSSLNLPSEAEAAYETAYQTKSGEYTAEKDVFGVEGKPGKATNYDKEMKALREEYPDETDAQLLKRRKELGRDPLMEQLLDSQRLEITRSKEDRASEKESSQKKTEWSDDAQKFWDKFKKDNVRPTQKQIDDFNATHAQLGYLMQMPDEGAVKNFLHENIPFGLGKNIGDMPTTPGQVPATRVDELPPASEVKVGTMYTDENGVKKMSDGTDWIEVK